MQRFLKLFSKENSIRSASIVLIITLTLSNILGLLRDRFLTKNIDTYHLDIYYASFRLPDLIFNFLILGAITAAFIPVFADYLAKKKKEEAFRLTNNLINLSVVAMVIFGIIMYFLMPVVMPWIANFSSPDRLQQSVQYSRILMLTPIFFSVSYIIGGVLNCSKRFLAYSLAPILYNLSIIFGGAVLAPRYGIRAVVVCVVAGSILHLLIQLFPAFRLGYRYKFILSLKDKSLKQILRLMLPRSIGMGANQIMLSFYNRVASTLAVGSISAFNLANNIQTVPSVVLGSSFATAIFPTLASKISEGKQDEFSLYLNKALSAIGFLLIPSTVIFVMFRAQIIRLILGSGKFSWNDTTMTALTLGAFSLSVLAQGMIPLLSKAFYALKDTRTPMYISIATVVVSVAIASPLSKLSFSQTPSGVLSVAGLALAFSVGSFFNAALLIYYLRRKYSGVLNKSLVFSYFKTIVFSAIMGLVIWRMNHILSNMVDMTRFVGILTQVVVSGTIGLVVFLALGYLFDSEEMKLAFTRKIDVKS
ncbi:MAG: murein biosynthesis integral membrane protein MurJ [Candidatus Berkelbacteria bacterium]|nr:murein biosynthesis integral membrane protein MurJ [Candidatus Berkelbacteria bacterium]